MSERISRTLFSRTNILNRRDGGWEDVHAVKGLCRKTVVFAHSSSHAGDWATPTLTKPYRPGYTALAGHSQGMWVPPAVRGLFLTNVGSFSDNLGLGRAMFSGNVGTMARCYRAELFIFSGRHNYVFFNNPEGKRAAAMRLPINPSA
jgi:hypothetical protein